MHGEALARDQRLRDPVHGLITFRKSEPLDQLAWELLGTPEFQRLRRIKQLGVSEFVYPGATHTRFAHSVGVFHTARALIEVIRRELCGAIDESRSKIAVIAALLHDLGHGPFSHTFEGVQKLRGVEKKHERWSAEIVLNPNGAIAPLLEKFAGSDQFGREVAEMLDAEDPIDLYHAVVSSSFDADRLDYLRRDRMMTGTNAGDIDFDWLLEHIRVHEIAVEAVDDDDDDIQRVKTFCLDLKALPAAEQFLLARLTLHEQVYFHKTTRCIEHLIARLLRRVADLAAADKTRSDLAGLDSAHPVWRFFGTSTPTLDEYLKLDDVVVAAAFDTMSRAQDAVISDIAARLRSRDLYKTLDTRSFGHDGGAQRQAARRIDHAQKDGKFSGYVYKDEAAKIGIYTQVGGDDEKMHKKLHIVDARGPREITDYSKLILPLVQPQPFTRYYFENDSDRDLAKKPRKLL